MLNVISVEEALTLLRENFSELHAFEPIYIDDAVGRITAEDIVSPVPVPHFDRSTMDGFAVNAADTFGSTESLPAWLDIIGEIPMGQAPDRAVLSGQCMKIATGGMLPKGANAVIPVENTDEENGVCFPYKAVSPLENVTQKGDDIKKGACVIGKNTVLTPVHIGLLACVGIKTVKVKKKLNIGILSTGDELIYSDEPLVDGKIREVNSHVLGAWFYETGCRVHFYGTVRDTYEGIFNEVRKATQECDAVFISGGSSAGAKDMTVKIIRDMGTVLAHGIAMKPGKPTIIGKVGDKPVFGLPGHPQACYFVTQIIVKPLIGLLSGGFAEPHYTELILGENISSNHGREEYLCVKKDGEYAFPIYGKSGILTSLADAYGYIKIGRNQEGLCKGERVRVTFFGG